MKHFAVLFGLALCLCSCTLYSGIPVQVDFTQLRADSSHKLVLMSYSLADSILVYKPLDGHFHGQMNFELELRNATGVVMHDSWNIEHNVMSSTDPLRSEILGQRSLVLAPGQYKVMLRATDAVRPKRNDSSFYDLVVTRVENTRPAISELLLCGSLRNVEAGEKAPSFERNGLDVVPRPSHEYRGAAPVIHSYLELYNLKSLSTDTVGMLYAILDGAGRTAFDVYFKRTVVGNAQTDVFDQDLQFMPTGTYYLQSTMLVPTARGMDSVSQLRKFFILNPTQESDLSDLRNEDEMFLASEFSTMSDSTINDEYRKATAVGPEAQLMTFPQLTSLNAKQKFIFRYWLLKDPDPSTPINERYEDFKKAVRHAQLNYKSIFSPKGWDCDMGRVLMRYGFPTNIDRQLYNSDAAFPYEVWSYDNIQGGVQFVFVNLKGRGRYVMVHSTAYNEKHDTEWYAKYATDQAKRN